MVLEPEIECHAHQIPALAPPSFTPTIAKAVYSQVVQPEGVWVPHSLRSPHGSIELHTCLRTWIDENGCTLGRGRQANGERQP